MGKSKEEQNWVFTNIRLYKYFLCHSIPSHLWYRDEVELSSAQYAQPVHGPVLLKDIRIWSFNQQIFIQFRGLYKILTKSFNWTSKIFISRYKIFFFRNIFITFRLWKNMYQYIFLLVQCPVYIVILIYQQLVIH